MKKTIAILSALFALIARVKEAPVVEGPTQIQMDNQEIKVDLTISRSDETKGSVKSGWADGDVVFIVFKGIMSQPSTPYLKMVYNGNNWTPTPKNGLSASQLSGATDKKMTAIYLPYGKYYGSSLGVVAYDSEYHFWADDNEVKYSGHFYCAQQVSYTYTDKLRGRINLTIAEPLESSDKLVHFDISGGFNSEDKYYLYQDYMKPMSLNKITAAGEVKKTVGKVGVGIPGYYDADPNNDGDSKDAIISFSGVLDKRVVDEPTIYRFLIRDNTANTAYSRTNIPEKTISENMYIGIGSFANTTNWKFINEPYFSVSATKIIKFAPGNLQYQAKGTDEKEHWRFATHQYDRVGDGKYGNVYENETKCDNALISKNYTGWIDLFAWGTTGWNNTENEPTWKNYQPWATVLEDKTETSPHNIFEYGPAFNSASRNLTGDNYRGDWGSIMSNAMVTWRLPTAGTAFSGEWYYIAYNRSYTNSVSGTNNARYAKAQLTGTGDSYRINGLILFPDNYVHPDNTIIVNDVNTNNAAFNSNQYDLTSWEAMESAGAVFLPLGGQRGNNNSDPKNPTEVMYANAGGAYMSSTARDEGAVYMFYIYSAGVTNSSQKRWQGACVRLVSDLN